MVHKYSEFIHFPIYLWTEKEVDVPVEEDEEPAEEADQGKCSVQAKTRAPDVSRKSLVLGKCMACSECCRMT